MFKLLFSFTISPLDISNFTSIVIVPLLTFSLYTTAKKIMKQVIVAGSYCKYLEIITQSPGALGKTFEFKER